MSRMSLLILVTVLVTLVYLAIPAVIALLRRHPERRLIYKLIPLTLLSFLLWFGLIAWAFTGQQDNALISRYVAKLRENNRLPWLIAALVVLGLAGSLFTLLR